MKIVGLTTVSGPYICARWSAVASNYPMHKVYLVEFGRVSKTYDWLPSDREVLYERVVLSEQASEASSPLSLAIRLRKELSRINPDIVVLNGYAEAVALSALIWAKLHQKPVVLLSESKEDDAPRSFISESIKRWIVSLCSSALVGGAPHQRYLVKLGMRPECIFEGYDVVGIDDFHPSKIKNLAKPCLKPYFLAINRFVPKKNLLFLLSAYAEYRRQLGIEAWDLVLCGDGPLRPQIEQQIFELNLTDCIHLPGFLQQPGLLPYFAHANCFIHASSLEQWGLVVNEAMAATLPVLVSNRCGCFEDLVIEGVNGFGFDPENLQQLTDLMLRMSSEDLNLEKMGQASLEHIQKFSPDYFAQGLIHAVECAKAHS